MLAGCLGRVNGQPYDTLDSDSCSSITMRVSATSCVASLKLLMAKHCFLIVVSRLDSIGTYESFLGCRR